MSTFALHIRRREDGTLQFIGTLDEIRITKGFSRDLSVEQVLPWPETTVGTTSDIGWVDITASKAGSTSQTKRFTVQRVRKGVPGTSGGDGATGADGPAGPRGNVNVAKTTTGTSWSNIEAAQAISDAGYGVPQFMDIVTLYNNAAGYSETRFYNGSSWIALTSYINGNLLVDGTIAGEKIIADSITGDKIAGNTITAGNINATGLVVDNASITTLKLAGEAVSIPRFSFASGSNTTVSVTVPSGLSGKCIVSASVNAPSLGYTQSIVVTNPSGTPTVVRTESVNEGSIPALFWVQTVTAGIWSFKVQNDDPGASNAFISALLMLR